MKKVEPIKETIEKELEKQAGARRRTGLLRETALLRFLRIPHIRRVLEFVAETLFRGVSEQPIEPRTLGESASRAMLRAIGRELRHLQDCADEVADGPRQADTLEGAPLDPADRRLCEWAAEQRREIMRLAVRFERRVGPVPEPTDD